MADNKLSKAEFVRDFIVKNRKAGSNGVHTVYSQFNASYRLLFNSDPVADVKRMNEFTTQFRKGGAMLYLKGEEPKNDPTGAAKAVLARMGIRV